MSTIGLSTLIGRSRRAKQYALEFERGREWFWLALGRISPWFNESSSPYPAASITYLPEVQRFYKVNSCDLVYPDSSGYIQTAMGRYSILNNWKNKDEYEIAGAKAFNLLIRTNLESDINVNIEPEVQVNLVSAFSFNERYAIVGLCQKIAVSSSVDLSYTDTLSPHDVIDYFLDWVGTSESVGDTSYTTHNIQILKEF